MDPADFASLLEREPPQPMSERERCAHELEEYGYPNAARLLREGPDSIDEKIKPTKTALGSAQERIKSLEDVLVAIRAKALEHPTTPNLSAEGWAAFVHKKVSDINIMIGETLDPCEPWCVAQQPHEGICMSAEDFGDGE